MSELQKRVLSALAMAVLLVAGVMIVGTLDRYYQDIVGSIVIALILARLGYEWSYLVPAQNRTQKPLFWRVLLPVCILAILGVFQIIGEHALYADFYASRSDLASSAIMLFLSVMVFGHVGYSFFRHFRSGYTDHALLVALAGVGYVSLGGIGFITLWEVGGLSGVYFTIILVVLADSAAYFGGKRWGRRKLCPSISPGKTWAGVVSALVAGLAFYGFTAFFLPYDPPYFWFCFLMIVLSIIGDLYISLLKRRSGLKDVASLIPGHGGLLDRLDGHLMVFAFTVTYMVVEYELYG